MDPYKVLGVPQGVGLDEVKRAFRRLVKRHHPDIAGRDPKRTEEFLRLRQAYKELAAKLTVTVRRNMEEVCRKDLDCSEGGGSSGAFIFVEVDAASALKGKKISLSVPDRETFCPVCNGLGKVAAASGTVCRACRGLGFIEIEWGDELLKVVCNRCICRGTAELSTCPDCGGRGQLVVERRLKLTIPPGTRDGTVLKFPGQGPWDRVSGKRKPLYCEISVSFPKGYELRGLDIHSIHVIDCWTALAGGYVKIPLLGWEEQVWIEPGTRAGHEIRFQGKGWPDPEGTRGDHVVVLDLSFPKGPCPPEAEELIRRLKELWPACSSDKKR